MKKLFTLISIVLLFATGSAQTVTLTFTGRDANNQTVALDSVVINNLTKGWQETLTTPDDTVLTLQNGTGIGDVETMCTSSLLLSQNKPNPFDGTTKVNLMVTEPGIVTLDITDVNGRIVRTNRVRPEIGTHQFRVTLSAPGTYVMTARQNGKSSSVKMVCNGTGNGNKIEYIGAAVETRHGTSLQTKSRTRSLTDNPFDLGDEMEYIGFATINGVVVESGHVTQAQNGSETIILTFAVSQGNTDGMPCPGTPTLTDIDGNVYNTVMIGTQCWMKENLRTMHYANGIPIAPGSVNTSDFDQSGGDELYYVPNGNLSNVPTYGLLYNWYAATCGGVPESSNDNPSGIQGICPNGWHLPSSAEASQMGQYLYNSPEYECGGISNWYAKTLADSLNWESSTVECAVGNDLSANNATGFTAMPAGSVHKIYENYQWVAGCFFGNSTMFWTTYWYSNSADADAFGFSSDSSGWSHSHYDKRNGYSVRCVRN